MKFNKVSDAKITYKYSTDRIAPLLGSSTRHGFRKKHISVGVNCD